MGKLTGSILLLAGLALATSTLASHQRPADVATPRAPSGTAAAGPVALDPAKAEAKPAEPAAPSLPPTPDLAPPPEKTPEPKPHIARKFIPPPAVRIAEAPLRMPATQSEPANRSPLDHAALTREIQRQLKRVGCYGGAITGVWSPAVRRAMQAFTDRANASLPVDEPDQILLAMVQNHRDVACSASCPPGQAIAEDGRCLPNALVARAKKRPAAPPPAPAAPAKAPEDGGRPGAAPSAVASAPAVPASRPMGRMSLAGPQSEPSPSIKGPAWARPPKVSAPRPTRRTRSQRAPRYADTRTRERRRDMRAYSGTPGYPWWAMRAFMP